MKSLTAFRHRWWLVAAAGVASSLMVSEVRADCQRHMQQFNQAAETSSVADITQAFAQLDASEDCLATDKNKARRATANRLFRIAYHGSLHGMPSSEVDQLLKRSESYAPTWRTLTFLGTQDHRAGHFDSAAMRLQKALALIDDAYETPTAPAVNTIKNLHQMASESLLLAHQFVSPPQVRGVSSGVLAQSVRGFSVQSSPLPIRFETASTKFTAQGLQAAEALYVALRGQGDGPVEIIGHADERGDEQYNMKLSLERAERVRDWLLEKGLSRKVVASGRGEAEPMSLSDASSYNQTQVWQLNRRVELVRFVAAN